MMPERPAKRALPWIVGLGAVALLSVGGAAWLTFNQTGSGDPSPITSESPIPVTGQLEVYWLNDTATNFVREPVTNQTGTSTRPDDLLKLGFLELLAGPSGENTATTIPSGTRLTDLRLESDGIHINLSSEFTQGGGSTSMQGRLGQVIYTATSLQPTAPVWLSVNGAPLTVLGGEGIEVKQPMTRQDFAESFSLSPQIP